ncbi:autophagy-related protein 27 [Mariannaea sp. PMI_226]|nr:autophagy-related protein 27 [Mariannaea sp. PMI_226]
MHTPQLSALLLSLLVIPAPGLASLLTCENIRVDGHSFDLSKLKGPHSVVTTRYEPNPPEHFNTTYTLDLCGPLKKSGKAKKGQECPNGTRVCAITHLLQDETDTIMDVTSIAGNLENAGGSQFEYTATRLKTSDSTADSQKEGLRLVLKGGRHPLTRAGREQRAVIELICDRNRTGTEGEWDSEDKYDASKLRLRADEKDEGETKEGDDKDSKDGDKDGDKSDDKGSDKDGEGEDGESITEHQLKKEDAALIWESYGLEKDIDVLRMTWYTKYACEKRDDGGDEGDDPSSSHWGFFTWFILIAFLGIATYLVFSSWLNYNRYGARGWDLLPHSDTIRDVPYLMKDWLRRVLNTVQGTGSRGGYSAV